MADTIQPVASNLQTNSSLSNLTLTLALIEQRRLQKAKEADAADLVRTNLSNLIQSNLSAELLLERQIANTAKLDINTVIANEAAAELAKANSETDNINQLLLKINSLTALSAAVNRDVADLASETDVLNKAVVAIATPAASVSNESTAPPVNSVASGNPVTTDNQTLSTTVQSSNSNADTASVATRKFIQATGAEAEANLIGNPAYANSAASAYVSMATSLSKQSSTATSVNTTDNVQPIMKVLPVNAISHNTRTF